MNQGSPLGRDSVGADTISHRKNIKMKLGTMKGIVWTFDPEKGLAGLLLCCGSVYFCIGMLGLPCF